MLLASLSACSREESPGRDGARSSEPKPLQVAGAATGSGLNTGLGTQTRADDRQTLEAGSIGIFQKQDDAKKYKALNNLKFDYGTPYWFTDEQILLTDEMATLSAYYPYATNKSNPVMLLSQRFADAEDLCYVNLTANNAVASVTLDLCRVYSRIVFNFARGTDADAYTGQGKVTAIRIDGEGIIPVATLDLFDLRSPVGGTSVRDVLDPFTGNYGVEIKGFTTQFTPDKSDVADCLMIPALLKGNISFTATIDGVPMKGKVTATQLCGASDILTEGTQYGINITVRPTRLELEPSSITRQQWDEDPVDGDYVIQ